MYQGTRATSNMYRVRVINHKVFVYSKVHVDHRCPTEAIILAWKRINDYRYSRAVYLYIVVVDQRGQFFTGNW